MNTNNRETWRTIDELSDVYGRLADRRATTWQQMTACRIAGAKRQAARLESQLQQLDVQGLRLAERIEELCRTATLHDITPLHGVTTIAWGVRGSVAAAAATQKGIGGA